MTDQAVMDPYRQAQNLITRYAELVDDGDFDGLGAIFCRGVIQFVPGGLALHGRNEVAQFYRTTILIDQRSGTPGTVHQVSNVLVQPSGTGLQARSRYRVTLMQEGNPPQLIASGRYFDQFSIDQGQVYFLQRRVVSEYTGDLSHHLLAQLPVQASNNSRHSAPSR